MTKPSNTGKTIIAFEVSKASLTVDKILWTSGGITGLH